MRTIHDPPGPGFAQIRVAKVSAGALPLVPRHAVLVDACDADGVLRTYELDWATFADVHLDPDPNESRITVGVVAGDVEASGLPVALDVREHVRKLAALEVRAAIEAERAARPLLTSEDLPPADAAHFPALYRALLDPPVDAVTLQLRPVNDDPGDRAACAAALRVIADELTKPTTGAPLGMPGSIARAAQALGVAMREAGHLVQANENLRARREPTRAMLSPDQVDMIRELIADATDPDDGCELIGSIDPETIAALRAAIGDAP